MTVQVQNLGLGPELDVMAVPDHPWMPLLKFDALNIIRARAPDYEIQFAITESFDVQAKANYQPTVILVTGGMVDAIFRFSAQLVTAGVFISFGDAEPKWAPSVERSFATIQDLIKSEAVRWNPGFLPWIKDKERVELFLFLALSLHRFVVLHELGHIVLGHGDCKDSKNEPIIEVQHSDLPDRVAARQSQARELAADAYAINEMVSCFEAEYDRDQLDPMRALIKSKLMGSGRERLRMVLFFAYAFFQILDRRNWTLASAMLATHPPAPARVKSALATALNMSINDASEEEVEQEVAASSGLSQAIIGIGFNVYPDLDWLRRLDEAEYDAWMVSVLENIPDYVRRKAGPGKIGAA